MYVPANAEIYASALATNLYLRTCQCRSSPYMRLPSYSSPRYVPQQHQGQPNDTHLQRTLAHARAAAAGGLGWLQEALDRVQGGPPNHNQPVKRPGVNVPAGMLKLILHDVELTTPGLCFCVLKIGPHWGRTCTLTASPTAAWDWEVTTAAALGTAVKSTCCGVCSVMYGLHAYSDYLSAVSIRSNRTSAVCARPHELHICIV